jgi:HD superfamily phosphohydrolase
MSEEVLPGFRCRIADLFRRSETADPQLSKLIHSSLDMDRLDYLMRDAKAVEVLGGLNQALARHVCEALYDD